MLPNSAFRASLESEPYLIPDIYTFDPLRSIERAGVALNDASQGLDVQDWTLAIVNGQVNLSSENGVSVDLFASEGVTRLALSFDQLMRPLIAYEQNGEVKLQWYDSQQSQTTTTTYANVRDPVLSMDDKRNTQVANSDIIFGYIRADHMLCYRQQRERFTIEHTVSQLTAAAVLRNLGMTTGYRVKFEIIE